LIKIWDDDVAQYSQENIIRDEMLVFMHATVIKIFKCFDGLNKKYYKQKKIAN
jgi:hypothetical protein